MITKVEHSIDAKTIGIIIAIVLGFFVLWKLADVSLVILTALMLASAFNPAVEWLHKKLPLPLSATIVVVGLLLPFIGILFAVIPQFISQIPDVLAAINNGLHQTTLFRNINITQYYNSGGQYLLESTTRITEVLRYFIILIVLTLYLLIDSERLHLLFVPLIDKKKRAEAEQTSRQFARISGQYIRGNLLISLICSIITLVGLLLLHVPYAVPVAIFAGVLDLLPLAGAIVGAIPAVVLAFIVSPLTGLLTIILFLAYQQFENAVLAPNIYNKALNLTPALSFIAVIIGGSLFGIPGAFLALPIAASLPPIVRFFRS